MISQLQRIGEVDNADQNTRVSAFLRSPDIPSVLLNWFYQQNSEERLLASDDYQEQLAEAIYKGLRNYFLAHRWNLRRRATAQTASTVTTPDCTLPN